MQLTSNAELLSLSMMMKSGLRVNGYRSPGWRLNTQITHTGISTTTTDMMVYFLSIIFIITFMSHLLKHSDSEILQLKNT